MKITVKIEDITVVIDRPKFDDYSSATNTDGPAWRKSLLEGTVLPTLTEAVDKAKQLYQLKKENQL